MSSTLSSPTDMGTDATICKAACLTLARGNLTMGCAVRREEILSIFPLQMRKLEPDRESGIPQVTQLGSDNAQIFSLPGFYFSLHLPRGETEEPLACREQGFL